MIQGVEITVDREAVVVAAHEPLTVLSSAFVSGGFTAASRSTVISTPWIMTA